jgi:manganese efflux pump family protein
VHAGRVDAPFVSAPGPSNMSPLAIFFLALAMSTDAFAAAVGKGIALDRPRWSEALRTGLIFGVIEAATPLIGWALGHAAADYVRAWDHWIAFVLLGILGLRMIVAAIFHRDDGTVEKPQRHSFWALAITGFATSIDAMAVGVGLAFLDARIVPIAVIIGTTTFVMVTLGVMLGRVLGRFAGRWAEAAGGVLLILIGSTILVEHLGGG